MSDAFREDLYPEEERQEKEERQSAIALVNHTVDRLIKLAILAAFVIALYYGSVRAYRFGYTIFTTGTVEAKPGTDIEITILEGTSDRNVGQYLEKQGLVKSGTVFYVQTLIYGYEIRPGTYVLNTSQSIEEMLVILSTVPK